MEGLLIEAVGRIGHHTDLPLPRIEHDSDALVRVDLAGLCGSDLHPFEGRESFRAGVIPGHEVVGRVIEVGQSITTLQVGDRVIVPFTVSCGVCAACRRGLTSRCIHSALFGWGDPDPGGPVLHGGQAACLRVPLADSTVVVAPDSVSDPDALLLCDNLPTGYHAALQGRVRDGATVAVVGLGAVGLCAAVAALALGAAQVTGIDPVPSRRAAAATLGIMTAAPEQVQGVTVSTAIDAAGPASAQALAAELVEPGGILSIIAVQTAATFAVSPVLAYDRNLTIRAGRAPVRALLDVVLPLVVDGTLVVPTAVVVTHPNRPLSDGPSLYRRFADREEGLIKASFAPVHD